MMFSWRMVQLKDLATISDVVVYSCDIAMGDGADIDKGGGGVGLQAGGVAVQCVVWVKGVTAL